MNAIQQTWELLADQPWLAAAAAAMAGAAVLLVLLPKLRARLLLSKAKHRSLAGHVRLAKRVARQVPNWHFNGADFFASDRAPAAVAQRRETGLALLAEQFRTQNPRSIEAAGEISGGVADAQFVARYRVPFQYSEHLNQRLPLSLLFNASEGVTLRDLDGNRYYDVGGSYGVNLMGNDAYKDFIKAAVDKAGELGPVLGPYHPLVADNVRRLRDLSGLSQVSFHMSGTEAVMQAVRLARYHTGRSHLVRFCGAYHGWWDDVQPGIGNPARVGDVYTLRDMHPATLKALAARRDVACVLVNPIQMLHPNAGAPGDGALLGERRDKTVDVDAYRGWLHELRELCRQRGIVFILDEVMLGFRLAYRGAQEYFGLDADLVTYGKTLGGGLPVGVVCGDAKLMRRYRDDRPADICFARGTFNAHPYVMAAMNEFLRHAATPQWQAVYDGLDERWNGRARLLNERLAEQQLPLQVVNLSSVFCVLYNAPSRYHWMLQFYLRSEGLLLGWIGTGRLIFSLNYSDDDYREVVERFVRAAIKMRDDGWWWREPQADGGARTIKRQLAGEMLRAKLRRKPV